VTKSAKRLCTLRRTGGCGRGARVVAARPQRLPGPCKTALAPQGVVGQAGPVGLGR